MRPAAEVGEVSLRVEGDRTLGCVDELDLVRLLLLDEARAGFVRRDLLALPLPTLCELPADLLFDAREIGFGDRLRKLEVVVEAVLDRRAGRDLHARVETSHGFGAGVRGRMPEHGECVRIVLVARRQDLDRLAVGERQAQALPAPA